MLTLEEPEKREPFSCGRFPVGNHRFCRFDWQPIIDGLTDFHPDARYASAARLEEALQHMALRGFKQCKGRRRGFIDLPRDLCLATSHAAAV